MACAALLTGSASLTEGDEHAIARREALDLLSDLFKHPAEFVPQQVREPNCTPIQAQSPTQACQSLRQMPFASTRTIAPFGATVGSGRSRTTIGCLMPSIVAARMRVSPPTDGSMVE